MAKIIKIEVDTKGKTTEEINKEIADAIKEVIKEEMPDLKKMEEYCNKFIVAIIGLVKVLVDNETFTEYADEYKEHMLKEASLETKFSFVKSFTLAIDGAVEDIVGLVKEYKMLSKDNKKGNEKKTVKKELSKKETQTK